MKRRNFLRSAALTPLIHNGLAINPLASNSFFSKLAATSGIGDNIMVFIELNGGNDGLNTLIPLDQYGNLSLHRQKVMIPENQVLSLSGVPGTGLHPAMPELRKMFDDGLVSIVQRVGYPNQDYSHFRSMDIWMTGSASNEQLNTGWVGRMLDNEYPGYPTGYPNDDAPDPLAIQIGSVAPVLTMGSAFPMGISVSEPDEIYDLVNDYIEPTPATPYGDELTYIRTVMQKSKLYFDVIKEAATLGKNFSNLYPDNGENDLADQLKIVAKLINGGLQTQIYLVSLGGFDTHSSQVVDGDTQEGAHADLLRMVSRAIGAFQDDIQKMGKADKVCGMTFSEFGRTIGGNDSFGTDHGAAAPLFVFGKSVNPGIIGTNPSIPVEIGISEDVAMQHDFRQVYASVLRDWFGLGSPSDILYNDFQILPIFKDSVPVHESPGRNPFQISNFPNPVKDVTTIAFTSPDAFISIALYDVNGKFVRRIAEGKYSAGTHRVPFDRQGLSSGTYFYTLRMNGVGVTKKMVVI